MREPFLSALESRAAENAPCPLGTDARAGEEGPRRVHSPALGPGPRAVGVDEEDTPLSPLGGT